MRDGRAVHFEEYVDSLPIARATERQSA
jgi:ketosteroid isomerase-like protein